MKEFRIVISQALREQLAPPHTQDEFTRTLQESGGYLVVKKLEDGTYAAISQLLTTRAIHLGLSEFSWARRFCYSDMSAMIAAWEDLKTELDEPEGWIAQRPTVGERY